MKNKRLKKTLSFIMAVCFMFTSQAMVYAAEDSLVAPAAATKPINTTVPAWSTVKYTVASGAFKTISYTLSIEGSDWFGIEIQDSIQSIWFSDVITSGYGSNSKTLPTSWSSTFTIYLVNQSSNPAYVTGSVNFK